MRKRSAYATKRAHKSAWDKTRHTLINPVVQAVVRANIDGDIERLRMGAGLHAYTGSNAAELANLTGRLVYIVCYAARASGLEHSPECRILAGTANALGDLAESPATLEQQRGAIVAGLEAIGRLMPLLDTWDLAQGAFELDALIAKTGGMGTSDVRDVLAGEVPA